MAQMPHRIAVLLVCVGALLAMPARADSWHKLRAAVQHWRVAETDGLSAELADLHKGAKDPDVAAVASFVRARVLARLGKGDAAQGALGDAKAIRAVLPQAFRWAEVEVLLAQGKHAAALTALDKLRHEVEEFRWAAADLLYSRLAERGTPGDSAAAIAQTLYAKSQLNLPRDELLARAARNTALSHPDEA